MKDTLVGQLIKSGVWIELIYLGVY